MKRIRIFILKRRLKSAYLAYRRILNDFPCGANLAEHISSRVRYAKERVNACIRKLKALDPTCKISELS